MFAFVPVIMFYFRNWHVGGTAQVLQITFLNGGAFLKFQRNIIDNKNDFESALCIVEKKKNRKTKIETV